ncbi:hypothetical protein ABZ318_15550 [Streptomyces sp. NPDC006197]|uniref:hypothetical protein n=1 Tax=Streptomyces sp. NPDC006197 TaxID=3156685 RepID=UPI0033A94DD0
MLRQIIQHAQVRCSDLETGLGVQQESPGRPGRTCLASLPPSRTDVFQEPTVMKT